MSLLLFFASGSAFFAGIGLLVAGLACGWCRKGAVWRVGGMLFFLLGVVFIALSSVPLPAWAWISWVLLAVFCRVRREIAFFFLLFSLGVGVAEGLRCLPPFLRLSPGETVYVIGDSLSAGIGTGETPWPELFGRKTGHPVVNLAVPGATVDRALREATRIPDGEACIIVEIGGNDLLGGGDSADFVRQLDLLLARIAGTNRQLAMFELPLPPFHGGFGKAQRMLAAKYHVLLLPRVWLASVLGAEGATRDGLHLSQKGSEALASRMAGQVREDR